MCRSPAAGREVSLSSKISLHLNLYGLIISLQTFLMFNVLVAEIRLQNVQSLLIRLVLLFAFSFRFLQDYTPLDRVILGLKVTGYCEHAGTACIFVWRSKNDILSSWSDSQR